MHSPPPVRAPKLQLAVEQSLTTIRCWIPPKQNTQTKKKYLTFKGKEEATVRQYKGLNHDKIKSHTHWVGDPQTGEQ